MKITVKTVQEFLDSIEFGKYAKADKITIKGDVITVTLADVYDDLGHAHEDIAKKFGFESVEEKFGNTTQYLVNMPGKGAFGFVKTYSKHHDTEDFKFVIFNKKHAISGKSAEFKNIVPSFLNRVEESISPHIQSIREMFTINKESLKNETPEQKKKNDSAVEKALTPFVEALKKKFIGTRETKVTKPKDEGSGVKFELNEQGKLVITQHGKVVGNQG